MNRVVVVGLVLASVATPAVADLQNGSFENGLTDWSVQGYVDALGSISGGGQSHSGGSDGGGWACLRAALGYGSATLSQTFTAAAWDTLTFDYWWSPGWLDIDTSDDTGRAVILTSGGQTLNTFFEYSPSVQSPPWVNNNNNGWSSAIPFTFMSSGSYTLQFEASPGSDGYYSFMGVDNAKLTPGVAPVPLPGAVLLGAAGLSFAGWRLRRRTV